MRFSGYHVLPHCLIAGLPHGIEARSSGALSVCSIRFHLKYLTPEPIFPDINRQLQENYWGPKNLTFHKVPLKSVQPLIKLDFFVFGKLDM